MILVVASLTIQFCLKAAMDDTPMHACDRQENVIYKTGPWARFGLHPEVGPHWHSCIKRMRIGTQA